MMHLPPAWLSFLPCDWKPQPRPKMQHPQLQPSALSVRSTLQNVFYNDRHKDHARFLSHASSSLTCIKVDTEPGFSVFA